MHAGSGQQVPLADVSHSSISKMSRWLSDQATCQRHCLLLKDQNTETQKHAVVKVKAVSSARASGQKRAQKAHMLPNLSVVLALHAALV